MRLVAATIVSLLSMSAAIADQKQTQSCVAQLSPESKLIFEHSALDVTRGADIKSTYHTVDLNETSSNTQWHNGWVLGFGAEHYLNEKFSAKAEYRYTDLGKEDADVTNTSLYYYHQNYDKENSIRIGVNYHF